MEADLILANPPYGKFGSGITKNIIETVDFKEYINLLPTNDYKTGGLFKHININFGKVVWDTAEAKTLPDICKLSKEVNNYETFSDYEFENVYDKRLRRFWDEQLNRKATISQFDTPSEKETINFTGKNSFCVGVYTAVNLVNDIKKSVDYFKINPDINKYIYEDSWRAQGKVIKKRGDPHANYVWNIYNPNCPITDVFNLAKGSGDTKVLSQIVMLFNSEIEKINFTKWWYSAELSGRPARSGLASILISMLHKPTHCKFELALPRVDWTREWTDLEILLNYGYTLNEATKILAIGNDIAKHRHSYGGMTFN